MSSDRPKDPIVERLRIAKEERNANADAAEGERNLMVDFQRQADKDAPGQVAKIETMFADSCVTVNADKDADDSEFQYNNATHELRAGSFSTYLELTQGFSPHRLDMVSGLRRDAVQVFAPGFEPEYEATNWTLFARMDEGSFFWECDGRRLSSEQVVEEGLEALPNNLAR